jgi:hypothetical protein
LEEFHLNHTSLEEKIIHSINQPSLKESRWESLLHMSKCKEDFGLHLFSNTEKDAENLYEKLINQLIKYHTKNNSLEEKLDKLLSHIDIIPGGEEYDKARDRFIKN